MSALTIRIKKIVALTFVLPLWAIFSPVHAGGQDALEKWPSAKQTKAQEVDSFPEGEGRRLLFEACVQCHDFKIIVSQRKTLAGWRRTVDEMVWRGAPLMGGEADLIASYLATSFGLDKRVAPVSATASTGSEDKDNLAGYLPKGEGRALVLQSCVRCHDLRKTVAARKTAAGWRRTVNGMVRLGASLSSGDTETIINYLAKAFGPDKPMPAALKVDKTQGATGNGPQEIQRTPAPQVKSTSPIKERTMKDRPRWRINRKRFILVTLISSLWSAVLIAQGITRPATCELPVARMDRSEV